MADVTPGRQTFLQIGIGEEVLTRQSWTLERQAKDIRRPKAKGAVVSRKVFSTGGDAWILIPQFAEIIGALTSGGYVQPEEVELAPGMVSHDGWRDGGLSGADPNAGLPSSGAPRFQKRVNQATAWNDARLADDEDALPIPPVEITQSYPLDRVLSGLVTYPEDTPFALSFMTPEIWGGTDALLDFYFGGETETRPDNTSGGQFCLRFRGSGEAELFEHDSVADDWREEPVETFRWNQAGQPPAGQLCTVMVIPYARAQIWFPGPLVSPYSKSGFYFAGQAATIGAGALKAQATPGIASLYHESRSELGHSHSGFMTGAGTVRVDVQRIHRVPFSIIRGVYPEEGILVDSPFEINRYLPADAVLKVDVTKFLYPGTIIDVQLYNAADNTPLLVALDDPHPAHPTRFMAVLGQRKYYAAFSLRSEDGVGTPALYGYSVDVEGGFTTRPATPLLTARITRLTMIGPDLEPTFERANVTLRDPLDETHIVREVDRLRTLISVRDPDTGDVVGHLMEGEISRPVATQRGAAGDIHPVPTWHDTDVRIAGLYDRLREQVHDAEMFSFASSKNGPIINVAEDPFSKGGYLPWKVTDVVRWLINHAGFPLDEIDVPDYPLRLWPSEDKGGTEHLAIYPYAIYGEFAAQLIKDYLGAVLVRDPNAGPRGMWRVLIPPAPTSGNILWMFSRDPAPVSGRIVTSPGVYGGAASFILKDTYQTTPEAPRASVVTVRGTGPKGIITAYIENQAALAYFNGRRVPVIRNEATLSTQEACNWLALRLSDAVCQPREWFDFTAPMPLVRDTLDPLQNPNLLRPLRVNDLINIRYQGVNRKAILRSVNPGYEADHVQMAHYQGRYYP